MASAPQPAHRGPAQARRCHTWRWIQWSFCLPAQILKARGLYNVPAGAQGAPDPQTDNTRPPSVPELGAGNPMIVELMEKDVSYDLEKRKRIIDRYVEVYKPAWRKLLKRVHNGRNLKDYIAEELTEPHNIELFMEKSLNTEDLELLWRKVKESKVILRFFKEEIEMSGIPERIFFYLCYLFQGKLAGLKVLERSYPKLLGSFNLDIYEWDLNKLLKKYDFRVEIYEESGDSKIRFSHPEFSEAIEETFSEDSLVIGKLLSELVKNENSSVRRIVVETFGNNFEKLPEDCRKMLLEPVKDEDVSVRGIAADNLERQARSLILDQNYSEAKYLLKQVIELMPERKQSLQSEFGFLFDFTLSAEEDEKRWDENRELIEWRKNFWWILSDENNTDLTEMQSQEDEKVEVFEEEPTGEEPVEIKDSELKPQEKGAILEKAVLKLFRRFFTIGEEQEEVILEKLRIQGGGPQFGFDVGFECTVKENENVRCHIECKNLEGKIKLSHIAEKIIQTEDDYSGIDHWILISPRSDPVGDLEKKVTKWNNKKKYPFKIQIWSPETRVDEFFGLDPDIYDQFYKSKEDETHPSQWSEKKRNEVFEKWKQKLKTVLRLPREWEKYMQEPFRMCIDDKEHDEFQALYQHYVPMRCMDERKSVLSLSLEDHVHEWLKDARTPIMLLLGGFGDGKTAFTYILSRNLAEEFLENPSNGWIPVRFALKDYYSAENSRKFLRERLKEFGADIDSWKELKGKHKLNRLVILDGFDEMTKELDPETITKNINSLVKCCDEFKGSKILITSRTYFFENQRNKERLLQKLRPYYLFYLAPIDRQTNIRHLEKHATTPDEKRKLKNMCKLHDPIGLASKPLFLHMVKETLSELPEEDLDEITLYNTYIKKSLYRKIENLEYDRAILTPDEIYSNIVDMMEEIALRIQELGENYFSLEEYQNTSKQTFAEILWKISNPEKDAAERVRIRTLLKQVKTKKDAPKQALDFCHRSMREYFVAKRLCRLLRENREKAKEFLTEFLLNNEILHFTAKLMGRNSSQEYKYNLLYLIKTTRGSNQSRYLGGNAATLLYRLKGELPGNDWSGLNLDYADLSRADLSNKNFRYTSLRFARLDNVNFEGADFRNCDLKGVRIEETAPVLAVTVPSIGDRIIAAYGDNTIRDWNIAQQSNYETQIICENTDGSINQLETHFGSDLCAITNEEVIFYDFGDQKELLQRARFRKKSKYGLVVAKKDILLLVSDEDNQMSKVLAIDLQQRKIICVLDLKKITLCENLDRQTLALPEEKTFLNIKRTETSNTETTISLPAHEVTSLCVRYCDESDKYLLAFGQRNGKVLVWQIDLSTDEWQHELVLENRVHEGLVSSLAFLDDSTIASGGVDRKISILRFGPGWGGIEGIEESDLQLIARCKGMKIDGIKRDIEQEMLRKLILKVEEITYHGNE